MRRAALASAVLTGVVLAAYSAPHRLPTIPYVVDAQALALQAGRLDRQHKATAVSLRGAMYRLSLDQQRHLRSFDGAFKPFRFQTRLVTGANRRLFVSPTVLKALVRYARALQRLAHAALCGGVAPPEQRACAYGSRLSARESAALRRLDDAAERMQRHAAALSRNGFARDATAAAATALGVAAAAVSVVGSRAEY